MIKVPAEFIDEGSYKDFIKEIKTLSDLSHPNVVQFLGACLTQDNIYLVTEYLSGGSIATILKQTPMLPRDQIIQIALDTAAGMEYLHKRKPPIIHRDLKPQNLLLTADGKTTKIVDFGSSRMIQDDQAMTFSGGTPQYTAPELIKKKRMHRKGRCVQFWCNYVANGYRQSSF